MSVKNLVGDAVHHSVSMPHLPAELIRNYMEVNGENGFMKKSNLYLPSLNYLNKIMLCFLIVLFTCNN